MNALNKLINKSNFTVLKKRTGSFAKQVNKSFSLIWKRNILIANKQISNYSLIRKNGKLVKGSNKIVFKKNGQRNPI